MPQEYNSNVTYNSTPIRVPGKDNMYTTFGKLHRSHTLSLLAVMYLSGHCIIIL